MVCGGGIIKAERADVLGAFELMMLFAGQGWLGSEEKQLSVNTNGLGKDETGFECLTQGLSDPYYGIELA